MSNKPRLSNKQLEIIKIICEAYAKEGIYLHMSEVLRRVSYNCLLQSFRTTVYILSRKGLIEIDRKDNKVYLKPTDLAFRMF